MKRKSEIRLVVHLDEEKVPEQIFWESTDGPTKQLQEVKSFNLSLWDRAAQETLRIDLWSKDLTVDEMKVFYINTLAGMAQSIRNATGDDFMCTETQKLCDGLSEHLKEEKKKGRNMA